MSKEVFIFGAGYKGKELLNYLRCMYSEVDVVAFIDNDLQKQGTMIDGIECISISEAIRRNVQTKTVLVSPMDGEEILRELKEHGFKEMYCTSDWLACRKKYFVPKPFEITDYKWACPFNEQYNSPYPDIAEVREKEKELFDRSGECMDINFNISGQLELIERMKYMDAPEWKEEDGGNKYRYHYKNSWFQKGSADALCYMIRILKPRNIIEVGSGYSTAVMLDTNEFYFENKIRIATIDPNAERLRKRLKPTDKVEMYEKKLQDVPVNFFNRLGKNDILFIDSSHISKLGSDVNYLFFEILPRIKEEVYIHIHDVYYPFTYLPKWVYEGQAWNESYILRAFLMNNQQYSVELFGSLLMEKYKEKIPEKLLECGMGSIWIKKRSGKYDL